MTVNKALLIGLAIFLVGVIFQSIEINSSATSGMTISNWAFLYVPLYITGVGFVPLYGLFQYIKRKIKK